MVVSYLLLEVLLCKHLVLHRTRFKASPSAWQCITAVGIHGNLLWLVRNMVSWAGAIRSGYQEKAAGHSASAKKSLLLSPTLPCSSLAWRSSHPVSAGVQPCSCSSCLVRHWRTVGPEVGQDGETPSLGLKGVMSNTALLEWEVPLVLAEGNIVSESCCTTSLEW